jgi:hypothetical protein
MAHSTVHSSAGQGAPRRLTLVALVALCLILRLPHLEGPLDLRFDAGVYYTLGTSLAEGKGYRLLNEPGEIHGTTYPPLLPALAAVHQLALGTSDPDVVGHALRGTFFVLFVAYVLAAFWMASVYLPTAYAAVAAMIVALHFRTNFHADYFIAELPFALLATLAIGILGTREAVARTAPREGTAWQAAAGLLAVATFFLRTTGIALLGIWVAESWRRGALRQTLLRIGVACVAVASWQAYLLSVKRGPDYQTPAYGYQRAPYQFYNVPYSESMWLVDLFNPEAGRATVKDLPARVGSELGGLLGIWGESVSIKRSWYAGEIAKLNRMLGRPLIPLWLSDVAIISLTVLILAGFALLVRRGAWLLPGYVLLTLGLILVYPAPGSLERYLASLTPISAVAMLLALTWVADRVDAVLARRPVGHAAVALVLLGIVGQEAYTLRKTYRLLYFPARWEDSRGRQRTYALYAFDRPWQLHAEALDWLGRRAAPAEIVATSTPHWAFLRTGMKAVQPPWEPDRQAAQRLLESVPATYLVIDHLVAYEQAGTNQRYSLPVVETFPDRWQLIYGTPDSGSRIYRRVAQPAHPAAAKETAAVR